MLLLLDKMDLATDHVDLSMVQRQHERAVVVCRHDDSDTVIIKDRHRYVAGTPWMILKVRPFGPDEVVPRYL